MPVLRVTGFDGVVPRTSPTLLAENQAQTADNTKSYSRELRPWNGPTEVFSPGMTSPIQTIYNLHAGTATAWLTWSSDVDAVPGPVADETDFRVYFTGANIQPRKTYYALATNNGNAGAKPYPYASYPMGVPAPQAPPSVQSSFVQQSTWNVALESNVVGNDQVSIAVPVSIGGTANSIDSVNTFSADYSGNVWTVTIGDGVGTADIGGVDQSPDAAQTILVANTGFVASQDTSSTGGSLETRVYVYTYVNVFGSVYEESGPSPPSQLVDVPFGGLVTLQGFNTPPPGYNIQYINIYREVSGASTDNYFLVAQIPISQTTYVDAVADAALGQQLPSLTWTPPPSNLVGLVALPCGSLAGFVQNTVYFSEPYYPHAWPLQYAISLPANVVGLGVFGQTLVACTDHMPYAITGSAPGYMSAQLVQIPEPCVSKNSIASDEFGVLYASPNGLVSIGVFTANVMTDALMRRDEWQAQNPTTMEGVLYDGKYVGVNIGANTGNPSMVLYRQDVPALSFLTLNATAAFLDPTTADLYVASSVDNNIYQVDANTQAPLPFTWTSKRFTFPRAIAWSALRLDAAYEDIAGNVLYVQQVNAINSQNATLWAEGALGGPVNAAQMNYYAVNGSQLLTVPMAASLLSVSVTIWADQVNIGTIQLTSFDPVRLPAFKARELYFTISGNLNTRAITLATSVEELEAAA